MASARRCAKNTRLRSAPNRKPFNKKRLGNIAKTPPLIPFGHHGAAFPTGGFAGCIPETGAGDVQPKFLFEARIRGRVLCSRGAAPVVYAGTSPLEKDEAASSRTGPEPP